MMNEGTVQRFLLEKHLKTYIDDIYDMTNEGTVLVTNDKRNIWFRDGFSARFDSG